MAIRLFPKSLLLIVAVSLMCIPLRADHRRDKQMDSIFMGAPSVFDPLALESALQGAIEALQKNTSVINLDNVAAAVGKVQGSDVNQRYFTLSGNVLVPESVPATASLPAVPGAPTQIASTPPSTVNEGPLAVFAEQLQTTSEIVNQRMQLERLISCQVTSSCPPGRATRAVIGFPISVNSDRQDALAEVQIRVCNNDRGAGAPKILALLPDEKTYNMSMLTNDTNQFSLAAAVRYIGIGASAGNQSQNLYLLQDTDTVALLSSVEAPRDEDADCRERPECPERPERRYRRSPSDSVAFGWQFRPVFGKRTVSPGTRWVYAVLQLPRCEDDEKAEHAPQSFSVAVRTCWRDFCVRNRAVGNEISGTSQGWQWANEDVTVPCESRTDFAKEPWIKEMRWHALGDGKFRITILGDNFWPGTQVLVGKDRFCEASSSLTRCGHDAMSFVAPVSELALSDVHMLDRYGRAKGPEVFLGNTHNGEESLLKRPTLSLASAQPLGKEKPRIVRRNASQCEVTVALTRGDLVARYAGMAPWAAVIGDKVIGPDETWLTTEAGQPVPVVDQQDFTGLAVPVGPVTLHFLADTQKLRDNSHIELRRLLLGDWGALQLPIPDPNEWGGVFAADQAFWANGSSDGSKVLVVAGSGFVKGVTFHASCGGTGYEATRVSDALLEVRIPKAPAEATPQQQGSRLGVQLGVPPGTSVGVRLAVTTAQETGKSQAGRSAQGAATPAGGSPAASKDAADKPEATDPSTAKTVTIFTDDGSPVTCPISDTPPPPKPDPKPGVEVTPPPTPGISQYDAIYVAVKVTRMGSPGTDAKGNNVDAALLKITKVEADGKPMCCVPDGAIGAKPGMYRLLIASPLTDRARLLQFAFTLHDPADGDETIAANCKKDIVLVCPDTPFEVKARPKQHGDSAPTGSATGGASVAPAAPGKS